MNWVFMFGVFLIKAYYWSISYIDEKERADFVILYWYQQMCNSSLLVSPQNGLHVLYTQMS